MRTMARRMSYFGADGDAVAEGYTGEGTGINMFDPEYWRGRDIAAAVKATALRDAAAANQLEADLFKAQAMKLEGNASDVALFQAQTAAAEAAKLRTEAEIVQAKYDVSVGNTPQQQLKTYAPYAIGLVILIGIGLVFKFGKN